MTEGREEKNWDKAKDAYNEVQNALISNKVPFLDVSTVPTTYAPVDSGLRALRRRRSNASEGK